MFFGEEAFRRRDGGGRFIMSPKLEIRRHAGQALTGLGVTLRSAVTGFHRRVFSRLRDFGTVPQAGDKVALTVTTPLDFTDADNRLMREMVIEAFGQEFGVTLGRDDVAVLPEPLAAAIFALHSQQTSALPPHGLLAVCDMGGGTTDMTLVRYDRSVRERPAFSVKSSKSVDEDGGGVGGNKITEALRQYVKEHKRRELTFEQADVLKKRLSVYTVERVAGVTVSRQEFEQHVLGRFTDRVRRSAQEQLGDTGAASVHVIPVGGSSRIPKIRQAYADSFSGARMLDLHGEQGREIFDSVVRGAAVYSFRRLSATQSIILEGRMSLPLSVMWGNGHLYECVMRNAEDGTYVNTGFHPVAMDEDGGFVLGDFRFFQRAGHLRDADAEPDYAFTLEGRIIAPPGKNREDIDVVLTVQVGGSMLTRCEVEVSWDGEKQRGYEVAVEDMKRREIG